MADTITLRTSTERDVVKIVERGPQGPAGGGGGEGSGTVTSVALASSDLTITGSPITTSGTITANLGNSGVTAGTYTKVTVDAKGRVTDGATATASDVGAAADVNPSVLGTLEVVDGVISCSQYGMTINAEENVITFSSVPALNGATILREGDLGNRLVLNANGSNSGAFTGGTGGSVDVRGGNALSTGGNGGNGGSINLRGGDAANNQGGSGESGGSIDLSGSNFGAGGSINLSSAGNGNGGSINTYAGGGSINTSVGGGSIDTRGTGSIEFGIAGTRTTLTGTATADRAISLPNAAGTLALTSDITKTAVGLGNVTNNAQTQAAIVPNTAPSAGQLLVGNAGGTAYAPASVSGDATLSSAGALTVANNAVTNAKLAQIATSTIKGRATSGTGNVEDLSSAQVLTILGLLGAIKDMKIVSPSSDVTATSSTTLSNVSGMSFSVAANTTYLLLTNLQVNCGAGGYDCQLSFPSILNNGTTASGFGIQLSGSNSVAGLSTITATTVRVSNRGTSQTTPSFSILLVRTDSTGGTANFQWAQNTSSAAASTISATSRALVVPLTT